MAAEDATAAPWHSGRTGFELPVRRRPADRQGPRPRQRLVPQSWRQLGKGGGVEGEERSGIQPASGFKRGVGRLRQTADRHRRVQAAPDQPETGLPQHPARGRVADRVEAGHLPGHALC